MPGDFTGTIERWHYLTGTTESTIQPALQGAVALFSWHYREQRHYSTGTTGTSGTIQPALQGEKALFNLHYK